MTRKLGEIPSFVLHDAAKTPGLPNQPIGACARIREVSSTDEDLVGRLMAVSELEFALR